MKREEALKRASELKDMSEKFEAVTFLENDVEFFEYVVKELQITAQEVLVQEQLLKLDIKLNQARGMYGLDPIPEGNAYITIIESDNNNL